MPVSVMERKMLYCPKCNRTYEEGTQRFCTVDGIRLNSGSAAVKTGTGAAGIFSSLLERKSSRYENDEKITPKPAPIKPIEPKIEKVEKPVLRPNLSQKVFADEGLPLKKEEKPVQPEKPVQSEKPAARLIKPSEIASGTAEIGDRSLNPTGRLALNWENPKVMLGQTVKGRYYVTEQLSQDDSGISYLAEDKIVPNKQVVVRVLMDEKDDEFLSNIFAEERVSLSHINHPNVVKVLDSGELLEGMPFVVTERVDGFSLKEKLQKLESFNPLRTGRVIRQASYALSEVHQNGILHRSLKPENIFLTVSEAGTEQVKVTDFVVSNGARNHNLENVKYLSPEQLEGKLPNFASDIYSLGVVAFQMLTGRLPFSFTSPQQLLKAQKEGLKVLPSNLRLDISPAVDEIFEKALAYNPSDRYPKARDFGDALFNALSVSGAVEDTIELEPLAEVKDQAIHLPSSSILIPKTHSAKTDSHHLKIEAQTDDLTEIENDKNSFAGTPKNDLAWEKRSPEPIQTGSWITFLLAALGILLLIAASVMIYRYASNRQTVQDYTPTPPPPVANPNDPKPTITEAMTQEDSPTPTEVESPPLPRNISQPPNTKYFENSKLEVKGDLAKNYRGFKLFYPEDWEKNQSQTNFVDVSKKAESGTPIEQFLVSYYESKGTFKEDAPNFPKLVEDSNKKLSKLITNYRFISESEKNVNQGWRGYEMKFEGRGETNKGEKITIWGRRLFIPAARKGEKSGFVITMLATSLSDSVKSADDVGIKGNLGGILETFEPSTLD
jgi:serine/threonine protein kinase